MITSIAPKSLETKHQYKRRASIQKRSISTKEEHRCKRAIKLKVNKHSSS